jgi:hypothetical protein
MPKLQVVDECAENGAVTRIADRPVVQVAHTTTQRVRQRADAAGGVEGLMFNAASEKVSSSSKDGI